jgi:hypothetical protein
MQNAAPQRAVIPSKAGIQYAATSRFHDDCPGILDHPLSRMRTTESVACSRSSNARPHSHRAMRPSYAQKSRPPRSEGAVLPQEGSRECRTLGASAAACAVIESTRVSHHGHAGNVRHSPRNGFNGFLRALLGDRAFLPPSPAEMPSSVGASGPHDFAVREPSAFVNAPLASTASRPAFVTIASRPSVERDGEGYAGDLAQK